MELIHFTEAALEAISQYRTHLKVPETYALRIGIKQKNEPTKRLLIGFDEKSSKDGEANVQGLHVIYSPGEVFFFAGMAIDYSEQANRKGFTFVELKHTRIDHK